MLAAAITLATGYVIAAVLRFYAADFRASLKVWYRVSGVACLCLAVSQVWLILSGVSVTARIIFGQTWATVNCVAALIQPVLVVIREHRAAVRYMAGRKR